MTLTVEIPAELNAQIERAARERGVDAGAFVVEATRAVIESQGQARGKGQDAIERGFGFLRGQGVGPSDEFLAQRHAEARAERDRDEAPLINVLDSSARTWYKPVRPMRTRGQT